MLNSTLSGLAERKPMTRYWLSWEQPSKDYRPMHSPPALPILGWWCSGWAPAEQAILCAVVEADSEEQAKSALAVDWPETSAVEFRFVSRMAPDYLPGDRFPLSDWMRPRFGVPA